MIKAKKVKQDFTSGPIFWRLAIYALPIMLTGLLQTMYGIADNIVVGRFSGNDNALAAVGSTTTVSNLLINLTLGFSIGAGIAVAQFLGAKDDKRVSESVHTSMSLSAIAGVFLCVLGLVLTRPVLIAMGTKPELIDDASLYLSIIMLGIPAQTIYNFGAAILRSVGDSKSSLYILASTGIANVLMNLLFVIVFNMSVVGVALSTIISQYASAVAVTIVLMRGQGSHKLYLSKLKINLEILKKVTKLGLPSGIQSAIFAFSGIIFTSSVNQFSKSTIYAFTVGNNVDNITLTVMNSFQQATMTFSAQNFGAKNLGRIKRTLVYSIFWAITASIVIGTITLEFAEPITKLYISANNENTEAIISEALVMMKLILRTYFLLAIMNVLTGTLRGLGYSLSSMLGSIACVVGGRLGWIFIFFPTERFHTFRGLLLAYPISWAMAAILFSTVMFFVLKKLKINFQDEKEIKKIEEVSAS